MYKIEPHMHVSETSKCAKLTAAEMIDRYVAAGYSTVIVTDHYTKNNFDRFEGEDWQEKAERFLLGYRNAKKAAEGKNITVLFGIEISFNSPLERNDYLVYGITEEFFIRNRELYDLSHTDFHTFAADNGMIVIQAHPYRDNFCIPTPGFVDGIEIYNSNPRHDDCNDKAELLAKEKGLYMTAGSDAHRDNDAAISGLYSETPIETMDDFIALIKSGKAKVIR